MSKVRNLVTGGAGFIGYHLCKYLLDSGEQVTCMDNFSSGRMENVLALQEFDNFTFIRGDVTEPLEVEVDRIYNLACPASPQFYQADPIATIKSSFLGALNVLDLATSRHARVLQASTSEVYGDPVVHPQDESYWGNVNPIGPRSCYDEGKRAAETLFFDYSRQFGTEIKVVRIFNTYGPQMRLDDGRVISNLLVQALTGHELTVYGSGEQTRSFCYIDDMIKGLVQMMKSPNEVTGPVNLGNPEEFTILELVDLVKSFTHKEIPVSFRPLPKDDPMQRKPDVSLAQSLLGWTPSTSLVNGIPPTLEYFRTRLRL